MKNVVDVLLMLVVINVILYSCVIVMAKPLLINQSKPFNAEDLRTLFDYHDHNHDFRYCRKCVVLLPYCFVQYFDFTCHSAFQSSCFYTGVWRTGMSTVPTAPPIRYVLGYRSRTLTLDPNPVTDPNPNLNPSLNIKKTTPECN